MGRPHFALYAMIALGTLGAAATARADAWGAIAYANATGHWGYYFNDATQSDAEAKAVDYCRQSGGTDCAASVWFTGCGSLARSSTFKWGTAYGLDAGSARSAALLTCTSNGGTDCRTLATICAADGVIQPVAPMPIFTRLNQGVIAYATSHLGQQIGDGQCWTLVNAALGAAGAQQPNTHGLSTYQFGSEAYGAYAPGDILQFEGVEFVYANGSSYSYPHHTAIVETVNGAVLGLLNQNVNGNMTVQRGTIDLRARTQGTITLFQPLPQ